MAIQSISTSQTHKRSLDPLPVDPDSLTKRHRISEQSTDSTASTLAHSVISQKETVSLFSSPREFQAHKLKLLGFENMVKYSADNDKASINQAIIYFKMGATFVSLSSMERRSFYLELGKAHFLRNDLDDEIHAFRYFDKGLKLPFCGIHLLDKIFEMDLIAKMHILKGEALKIKAMKKIPSTQVSHQGQQSALGRQALANAKKDLVEKNEAGVLGWIDHLITNPPVDENLLGELCICKGQALQMLCEKTMNAYVKLCRLQQTKDTHSKRL